jgi:hypothetical protein
MIGLHSQFAYRGSEENGGMSRESKRGELVAARILSPVAAVQQTKGIPAARLLRSPPHGNDRRWKAGSGGDGGWLAQKMGFERDGGC